VESAGRLARRAQPGNRAGAGLLAARVESIAGKLIELAEGGDMRAIRCVHGAACAGAPATSRSPWSCRPIEKPPTVSKRRQPLRPPSRQRAHGSRGRPIGESCDVTSRTRQQGFDERLGKLEKGFRGAPAVRRMPQSPTTRTSEARSCRPPKLLTELTNIGVATRIYPLWVDARDTPADIDAKRDRLIAAGRARPTTRLCAFAGKGRAKLGFAHKRQPFPPGALTPTKVIGDLKPTLGFVSQTNGPAQGAGPMVQLRPGYYWGF